MARTSPVHTGYTVVNGSGSGKNGGRIDVWVEYLASEADVAGNRTWLSAYFYTALNPSYTSSTSRVDGLYATFSADGIPGQGVTDGPYDFRSADRLNLLGSFAGWISHDPQGEKSLTLSGSFTTASQYITGGSVSAQIALPKILRAAQVWAGPATLGGSCNLSWTPAVAGHSFCVTCALGNWSNTSSRIYPGTDQPYTYTGMALPLEIARQFAGSSDTMTVSLTTYDGNGVLGTSNCTCTVTVPENERTAPAVTAILTPLCDAFPDRYVQKLGSVSAQVTAQDPLGAPITQYRITAGSAAAEGTVCPLPDKAGSITVTVTAINSRGFAGTDTQQIQVLPYESPRLHQAAAYRSLSDGTADPGGTFLRITGQWSWSDVEDQNDAQLYWRYRAEGETFSAWAALVGSGSADTGAMEGIVLERTKAYTVELAVRDSAKGVAVATFSIPIEAVYMHRTKDALGIGGYARGSQVMDVSWDIHARKNIHCDGAVAGLYTQVAALSGSNAITLQTKWTGLYGSGNDRQSVFLFGYDNTCLVYGLMGTNDAGACVWQGSEGVWGSSDPETGRVTVHLPAGAYDRFVLLSAEPFSLV